MFKQTWKTAFYLLKHLSRRQTRLVGLSTDHLASASLANDPSKIRSATKKVTIQCVEVTITTLTNVVELVYRARRSEARIQQMLWKVNYSDIVFINRVCLTASVTHARYGFHTDRGILG